MTKDISMMKAKVLQFMDQEIGKYGSGRMDVKQIGELADIVKDLAEAEYHCALTEAMGTGQESIESMGYNQGYGMSQGHDNMAETMQVIREAMSNADPKTRAMIRKEFMR